ncbi:two component transcriptional regulator, LuxR family [Chthoniobacter flavus Ellin428]|uniref:Two component transcriptional regulator, LuxR family n=1 Tax=Chthoniobacter flavus Ellin428 TaxID=497964 RepID=B4D5C2_9BACT|nr:response regulator transcription factor [Chthoniobacter flavus]EDY18327.1 two component transcriptional regulator, LuxR family [Chthoniobacter flavus Ellin428]TCO91351.1 LuxR family two component transcriptional regulator [Chthoniobacter flavus]
MKTSAKIRVMLVDDHFAILMGLRACLKPEGDIAVIAEAADGGEAIEQYRAHLPDITLMDLSLPRLDGVAAIRTICREFPEARIIALTTRQGDDDIHQALSAGARSYVMKNMPRQEMLRAIRAVHDGQEYLPQEVQTALLQHEKRAPLTPRELEVIRLLARGCSNKEIGMALGIAEITAKIHVSHLLSKMGVLDRSQAVMEALRHGIIHLDGSV